MVYRVATADDFAAIQDFISSRDYFMPVDPAVLGGHWLAAMDDDGAVHGTIWFFHQAPHAYVDYWSGDSGIVAARLGVFCQNACKMLGVKYIRGAIADGNESAVRMARDLFDMHEGGDTYRLVFRSM